MNVDEGGVGDEEEGDGRRSR